MARFTARTEPFVSGASHNSSEGLTVHLQSALNLAGRRMNANTAGNAFEGSHDLLIESFGPRKE